ncbi:hypothetical protein LCGC14_0896900 [marine sediment metagenome]|uniref:Uncharacterized protein n=1 Tax=marine sediment metagenome TaxID=412755 RepID=A0A0F9NXN5_9ZZZZ
MLLIALIANVYALKISTDTYKHYKGQEPIITTVIEEVTVLNTDEELQETIDRLECENDWTKCKAITP